MCADAKPAGQSPALQGAENAAFDASRLTLLLNASRTLASTTDLDQLLSIIVSEVRKALACDGVGVALYDEEKKDFYWRIIQDKESLLSSAREKIRIPKGKGVGGWVFNSGRPALVHDAASDPRLYRHVESESGFTTRNMLCVPLKTVVRSLGVLYALNKIDGSFNETDVEILMALSVNVALALENASSYERLVKSHGELERLNSVKNKILHHLSHELKTPLAIIEASLKMMEKRLAQGGTATEKLPFQRLTRNLERLKALERQVGQIVEGGDVPERKIISDALGFLNDMIELEEEDKPALADAVRSIKQRIEGVFPERPEEKEGVAVPAAFQAVLARVNLMTARRILDLRFIQPDPVSLKLQPHVLMSVIGGLVRNAVENTPDHGRIVVSGEHRPTGYTITVRDHGVGIPETEQPNVFEGFYPLRETELYTSGSRYAFNAGGTGTDLLKIKIFSERFGFAVRFHSSRCSCIPTMRDLCPGDITLCRCCDKIEECLENGGTEFVVEIPPRLIDLDAFASYSI
jgi:signal transduction histidine kinase